MSPRIYLISGPSESGKTTLIERLIPALEARGAPAATAKHHRGTLEVDRPGKDTWRHRRAGAKATFFVTDGALTCYFDRKDAPVPEELAALCPEGVKVLLVEGFKGLTGYRRVEVVRRGVERGFAWTDEILCVATDVVGFSAPCPVFALDDADAIAALLVQGLL